ncbi:MAG: hypothetical protein E7499_05365 [Ruminococcus sp.]|nr:hypothetical protein [Ruminococcus sp.]
MKKIISATIAAALCLSALSYNAVTPNAAENDYLLHSTFESGEDSWTSRGSATVAQSSKIACTGKNSLYISGRTASWNGCTFALGSSFIPGNEYSFSANVAYTSGNDSDIFHLTLQYNDGSGETKYDKIATETVTKNQWTQLANTSYTIPAAAEDLQLYIETDDSTTSFYTDEICVAAGGTIIEAPDAPEIPITTKPGEFFAGDVNLDAKVDVFDITALRKSIISSAFNSDTSSYAADVNADSVNDISDLVLLSQYIIGRDVELKKPEVASSGKMRPISEYTPEVLENVREFETNDSKQEKPGVQYGTVKSGSYYSTTCNRNKPYNILLPAGYSEDKQYPVLYVMHGYWEDQDRMIIKGNGTMYTRQIIGNAIAEGAAEDMIVVFPYIYSSATQDSCSAMDDANNKAYDNFINDLTKDLMPHIEQTYSIKTGRENTAITGFSMGGRESLLIGMQRADLFGYVGAICAAPGVTGSFNWPSEEEAPSLVFLTAGSNDEVVYTTPEGYHNNFTKNNVPHIWHYVNGGYHGDNSIHAHLYNFVRAVFKADK